jgi:hypothetical protein
MSEPASSTALFLRSLTQNWDRNESIDIITYLDAVLKWDTVYLQEVMTLYSTLPPDEKSTPVSSSYSEDLSVASQKLVLWCLFRYWLIQDLLWLNINWLFSHIGLIAPNVNQKKNVKN